MTLLQPSASRTHLFLNCQWAFGRDCPPAEVTEEMQWGNAFHAVMHEWDVKTAAQKYDVPAKELRESCKSAREVLSSFESGENPWNFRLDQRELVVCYTESAWAYDLRTHFGRSVSVPDEVTHTYPDLKKFEIAGTVDRTYAHRQGKFLIVLDYKTGWYEHEGEPFNAPRSVSQLRTLALAMVWDPNLFPDDVPIHIIVGILHAPRRAAAHLYVDELTNKELEVHEKDLMRARRNVGSGYLRPGKHCDFCPARSQCPTTTGQLNTQAIELLRQESAAMIVPDADGGELTEAHDPGWVHQLLGVFEVQIARAREDLRALVREQGDGAITRPDGRILVLKTKTMERLSKEVYRRALGPARAEKEFERLRKLGVLTETEQEELHAVFERG